MNPFRPGQKVVCIDAHTPGQLHDTYLERLVEGDVYTIRWPHGDVVSLMERPKNRGFANFRFRPLDDLEQQLSRIEEQGAPVEQEQLIEAHV